VVTCALFIAAQTQVPMTRDYTETEIQWAPTTKDYTETEVLPPENEAHYYPTTRDYTETEIHSTQQESEEQETAEEESSGRATPGFNSYLGLITLLSSYMYIRILRKKL